MVSLAAIISRPTLGGWTVEISNTTNTAGAAAAPRLSCLDALRTIAQKDGIFLFEPGRVSGLLNRVNSEVGSWEEQSYGGSIVNEHPCGQDTTQSLHMQPGLLTSRYFQAPRSDTYTRASQLSTETWFKTTDNQGAIVSLLSPGLPLLGLGAGVTMAVSIDAQGQLLYLTNDASTGVGNVNRLTGPIVSDGQWHQVVTTWDDTTKEMNFYLDGALIDSQIAAHEMTKTSDSRRTRLYYGNSDDSVVGALGNLLLGNDTQLRGEIAYAAGWERVLTPAEIAWHWDSRNN